MSAHWFELTVDVPVQSGEAVANFLIERGAPGIQSEERADRTAIVAHFSDAPPVEALRRFCRALSSESLSSQTGEIRVRQIQDEDWAQNWRLFFRRELVGERLCVCPSWDAAPPDGRLAVVIDPGMAFGTGQHATTRGCLALLEWAIATRRVARALDVGTGSGVLAIALAKLGVPDVWAIDDDPVARSIAHANAARNAVGDRIGIASHVDEAPGRFSVIVANLFARLLEEFAERFASVLAPGGVLICSGLLVADEARVRAVYHNLGLEILRRQEDADWVTLALHRTAVQ